MMSANCVYFKALVVLFLGLYGKLNLVNGACGTHTCRNQWECAGQSYTSVDENDDICCDGYFGCYDGNRVHALRAPGLGNSADIYCGGYYGCGALDEVEALGGIVTCFGERSCYDTRSIGGFEGVTCSASFSCGDDSSTGGSSQIYSSLGNIYCTGPASCYSRDDIHAIYDIFCEGPSSCANSGNIKTFGFTGDILCRGFYSCHSSGIEATGVVYCVGEFSCQSSLFITSTDNSISCSGQNSCSDGGAITTGSAGSILCEGSYSCSNAQSINSGLSLFCRGFYSCSLTTIIVSSGNVWCVGEAGCESSTITAANTNVIIRCEGQYACRYATLNPSDDVYCTAEQSCYSTDINDPPSNVYCSASQSCAYSTIDENLGTVYCSGPFSCLFANINGGNVIRRRELMSSNPTVFVRGYYGAKDATFVVPAGATADFYFSGENAGDGASIECGDGATCNIYCSGNGCEGLTADCDDAECVVDCDPSMNIDCPTIQCQSTLNCPSQCSSDPCDCNEVQNCRDGLCHANGCSQCKAGYFKKDYNYHCAQCQEVFGDDCMHCTDFLGCQQCQTGTRTYDHDCGLWYCKDPQCH